MIKHQKHGADSYGAAGDRAACSIFSSSVVEVPPPAGWEGRLKAQVLPSRYYPKPYASGLASHY